MSNLLLAGLLLIGWARTLAQQPFQYKYTLEDGLSYLETTNVNFTSNGELWVSYSNGESLSRFDGLNWTHFPLEQMNLPLRLKFWSENSVGTWFTDRSDNQLNITCFTHSGQWKTYRMEGHFVLWLDNLTGSIRFLDDQFFAYHFDSEEDAFIKASQPIHSLKNQDIKKAIGISNTLQGDHFLKFKNAEDNYYGFFGDEFEFSFDVHHPYFRPISFSQNEVSGSYIEDGKLYWYTKGSTRLLEFKMPSGRRGEFVGGTTLHDWNTVLLNNAAMGVVVKDPLDNTLYLYRLNSLGQSDLILSHLHSDYYSSSFAKDRQGNWWYGTSTGLVRTNPAFLTFNENSPAMVSGLHAIGEDPDGNIWLGGYNGLGGFAVFDGKELHRRTFSNEAMGVLPGTLLNKSGAMYFFTQSPDFFVAIKNNQLHPITLPDHNDLRGYYFLLLSNGKVGLGLTKRGLGIAEETDGLISSVHLIGKEKGLLLDNVLTLSEDHSGRIWTGRPSQGIAIYDPQLDTAVTWLRSPEQPESIGAVSSCVDEKGTLWLGAHNGLYQLERPHEFDYFKNDPINFIQKIVLPGRDTSTIYFLKKTSDYLVAGSQLGIYFIDNKYRGKFPRIFSLKYGQDLEGNGSEQNAVLLDSKGYLWVGTQTGATRIDLNKLHFDTSATEISLLRFQAADVNVAIEGNTIGKIPTGRRTIDFSFATSGNVFFRDNLYYNLAIVNGRNDTLFSRTSTREKELRVDYLPPGDYILHIMALNHNVVSGQAAFAFSVPKILSERPWFWLALSAVVLGIPFSWFYLKKRHQADLEKAKREQDALKIQVLSNFFNPHFINNALHWVQSKYRKDQETTVLMGRLADNVDILYNNTQSGKAYHSLTTELELVKNYLKIQQVRFEEALTLFLDLSQDKNLLEQVRLPSMLLQIHVENAIEKGIRGRKGASRFSMAIRIGEKGCHITIEDDGRGRPAKHEWTTDRKGSTEVMNDLLALFNTYNRKPLTVRYEDHIFHDSTIGGYGTRVVIFIPKNYHYEF